MTEWYNCFSQDITTEMVTKESIQHPAKMSPRLVHRIYQHLKEQYGLTQGDHVIDPFGGIGMTGVIGCRLGYDVTLVELSEFFIYCMAGGVCSPLALCPSCIVNGAGIANGAGLPLGNDVGHYYHGNAQRLMRDKHFSGLVFGDMKVIMGDSRYMASLGLPPANAILTSPPYENVVRGVGKGPGARHDHKRHSKKTAEKSSSLNTYGNDDGQIGRMQGDNYWQSVTAVYRQCRLSLIDCHPLVVVVKNFIRGGEIIDMGQLTIERLEAVGFTISEVIHAMLTDSWTQPSMVGDVPTKVKVQETVWRRALRRKGLAIDYESVIFATK